MKLSILIGPSSPAEQQPIAEAFTTNAQVDLVGEREAFRHAVLAKAYDCIILCSVDGDGVPNEPLLRFCLGRLRGQRIVNILPGTPTRLPDVDFDASANLSYYPLPVHPLPADFARLAEFVNALAGRHNGDGYAEA